MIDNAYQTQGVDAKQTGCLFSFMVVTEGNAVNLRISDIVGTRLATSVFCSYKA